MTKINKGGVTPKKWVYWQFFCVVVAFYIGMTLSGDYKPLLRFNVWYLSLFNEFVELLGVTFIFWLPFKIFIDIKDIFQTSKDKRMKEFKVVVVKYSKGLVILVSLAASIAMMLVALSDFQQFPNSSIGIIVGSIVALLYVYYLLYKCEYKWFKKKFYGLVDYGKRA